jgi:hypothetical protein
MVLTAQPAHAQAAGSQDFSAGYQYTHISFTGGSDNIPAGWYASYTYPVAKQGDAVWGVFGEVNGAYKNGGKLHVYGVGVRGTFTQSMQAKPYVEFLVGGATSSGGGSSTSAFALQLGGGVDVPAVPDKVDIRIGVDYRREAGDLASNDVRVIAGVVIPFGTK